MAAHKRKDPPKPKPKPKKPRSGKKRNRGQNIPKELDLGLRESDVSFRNI